MVIWKKKDSGYVDLSSQMKKQQSRIDNFRSNVSESNKENVPVKNESSGSGFFGFFGGGNSSASSNETPTYSSTETESSDEKRSKLAKRLMDMTSKIEGMENEIYQLKQKIEVLEKKQRLGY